MITVKIKSKLEREYYVESIDDAIELLSNLQKEDTEKNLSPMKDNDVKLK